MFTHSRDSIFASKMVGLFLFCLLVLPAIAGCGGGNQASAPADSQAKAAPSLPAATSTETAAEKSTEPPNETSMAIGDMPKETIITEEEQQQGDKPADAVPDDIPILDNAKNKAALKIGDGKNPGDPYYQISFHVADSVKKAGEAYRKILKDKGLEISDESDQDGVQIMKVDTKSTWDATIMIMKFLDHSNVSIVYAKK